MENRFFLGTDVSGHWYLIPLARKGEWEAFAEIDEDDERSWDVPDYARAIDSPGHITFSHPE